MQVPTSLRLVNKSHTGWKWRATQTNFKRPRKTYLIYIRETWSEDICSDHLVKKSNFIYIGHLPSLQQPYFPLDLFFSECITRCWSHALLETKKIRSQWLPVHSDKRKSSMVTRSHDIFDHVNILTRKSSLKKIHEHAEDKRKKCVHSDVIFSGKKRGTLNFESGHKKQNWNLKPYGNGRRTQT